MLSSDSKEVVPSMGKEVEVCEVSATQVTERNFAWFKFSHNEDQKLAKKVGKKCENKGINERFDGWA